MGNIRRPRSTTFSTELVVEGARFLRNRASDQGKSRFVIVDRVETIHRESGDVLVVHYHCTETGRKSHKEMERFRWMSEFVPVVPEPTPPPEEATPISILAPEDMSIEGRLTFLEVGQREIRQQVKQGTEMLREILDILRRAELGPLFSRK